MYKIPLIAAFILAAWPAAAQMQVAQATPGAAARALGQRIGVTGAVRGAVYLTPSNGSVGEIAKSGAPVHLGDKVRSGPDAGLQVILLDETVFSIGPDAELSIDEFVFDPTTDAGSVAASVTKGAFRFITGRVAIKDPKRMNVRLPQATIGVRGTMVAGEVRPAENVSEVVLLGPGPDNSANDKIGAIVVSNAAGSVMIERPGFATTIAMLAPPSPPVALPPDRVRSLSSPSSVSAGPRPPAQPAQPTGSGTGSQTANPQGGGAAQGPSQGPSQGPAQGDAAPRPGVGSGGQQAAGPIDVARPPDAGMGLVAAKQFVEQQPQIAPVRREDKEKQDQQAAQNAALQLAQQVQSQISLISTFNQLLSIPSGTTSFTIAQNPITLTATSGTGSGFFGYSAVVDHSTRLLNFQVNANFTIGGTPYSGPVYAEVLSYGSGPHPVGASIPDSTALQATVLSTDANDGPRFNTFFTSGGRNAAINVQVQNNQSTGRIFHQGTVTLTVNSGPNTLTGTGTAVRP